MSRLWTTIHQDVLSFVEFVCIFVFECIVDQYSVYVLLLGQQLIKMSRLLLSLFVYLYLSV